MFRTSRTFKLCKDHFLSRSNRICMIFLRQLQRKEIRSTRKQLNIDVLSNANTPFWNHFSPTNTKVGKGRREGDARVVILR